MLAFEGGRPTAVYNTALLSIRKISDFHRQIKELPEHSRVLRKVSPHYRALSCLTTLENCRESPVFAI